MNWIKEFVYRLRGEYTTEKLIKRGMKVGKNFGRLNGVILDPRVHILCHDASTKHFLGYTKIGRVNIGDNVFIGAESVVLPGVSIGSNVIVGANSTVTKSIPDNTVVAGSPASIVCSLEEYLSKNREKMKNAPVYGVDYTLRGNLTDGKKDQMVKELERQMGYID